MEPYYYQTLSKAEQSSYQALQAGLQAFAPSFPVPLLENRALADVFMKLRLDCPQLFDISISLLSRFQKCGIDSCVSF